MNSSPKRQLSYLARSPWRQTAPLRADCTEKYLLQAGPLDVYIVRRTQLYLHDDTWKALHIRSRQQGKSISELVRQAVRDKYGRSPAGRREAMQDLIGLWKDRRDLPDSNAYVRRLRKGTRLRRITS